MNPRFLILEGPPVAKLPGWRHYWLIEPGHTHTFISQPGGVPAWLSLLSPAKFFAAGTWELEFPDHGMPTPKAEVLAQRESSETRAGSGL